MPCLFSDKQLPTFLSGFHLATLRVVLNEGPVKKYMDEVPRRTASEYPEDNGRYFGAEALYLDTCNTGVMEVGAGICMCLRV